MEGYSSDGSCSFFTSKMPDESQFPCEIDSLDAYWVEELISSDFGVDGGLTESLTEQDQLNQVETSEASYQTRSGGGSRAKLTPAQKRENKRQSDCKYRQKRKITADEQTAEIRHLKEENERLNAENRMLKMQKGLLLPNGQLPAVAPHYITQSTGKQLEEHQSVSVQDHHGTNSEAADRLSSLEMNELHNLQQMIPVNVVSNNDYVGENQKKSQVGTCCNDDTPITDHLLMKIDADAESKVKLSDFTGLDGEHITVGKYSFPLSLHPTVKRIIDVHGDISATSMMNPSIAETIYIMFCASVKEMSDLQLEQVTEGRILKWRDAIKDALRINFKVDFAMEHLKKIACAYIGLMERRKMENVAMRISKLEAKLSAGKEERAKICEQSKVYMDAAEKFIGKPVSSGWLTAENKHIEEHIKQLEEVKGKLSAEVLSQREGSYISLSTGSVDHQSVYVQNKCLHEEIGRLSTGNRHLKLKEKTGRLTTENRHLEKHMRKLQFDSYAYRRENDQILTSINIKIQHYLSIEAENSVLRAQLMELSERLQSLNKTISFFHKSNDASDAEDTSLPAESESDSFRKPGNLLYLNQPIMASADMFQL